MENQIYRVRLSDDSTLEFYVGSINGINPLRDIKELGIVVLGKDLQLDGDLDSTQLESLICYLQDCRRYIEKFNENSKPKE
jgi:hypothetical protein